MVSPLITVITPAYNIEQYIAEAIESVLAQTERDFEYLVVDDGSTDSTAEIAREFAARDSRIRVLQGNHAGSSAARNLGLAEAKGEYVSFCDGDDRWHPTFLAESLATLKTAPKEVGATFCAFNYVDQHGRPWGKVQRAGEGDYDANRNLAGHCPQGTGSCLVIRKSCFDEAGVFDEEIHNSVDLDMWLRINLESSTPLFRYIPQALVDWRVRPGSISSSEQKRVHGLHHLFQKYGHVITDERRAQAYEWPAVLAYYAGEDDLAHQWMDEVRKSDPRYYLHGKHGVVLGVFTIVGGPNGRRLRSFARSAVKAVREARMSIRSRPAAGTAK